MASRKRKARIDSLEIGDDQAVDLLLRVANGPEREPRLLADLSRGAAPGAFVHASRAPVTGDEVMRLYAEFQPLVQMAIDDPRKLQTQEYSRRMRELVAGHGEGLSIKLVGASWTRNGKQTLRYARVYKNVHAELSHGVLLLLDGLKSYIPCRCKLPRCDRYYLAKKQAGGGPANRTYCTSKHRDEYRDSAHRKATARKAK